MTFSFTGGGCATILVVDSGMVPVGLSSVAGVAEGGPDASFKLSAASGTIAVVREKMTATAIEQREEQLEARVLCTVTQFGST